MIINWGDVPFKAFITVTYDRGTCTVTNGTETYTHTGGGTTTFVIKKRGEWTVKAVLGTLSDSKTVDVNTYNFTVAVTLKVWDGTLYNAGKEYTEITGGWHLKSKLFAAGYDIVSGDVSVTKNASNMFFKVKRNYSGGRSGLLATVNPIDVTNYSKLVLTFSSFVWTGDSAVGGNSFGLYNLNSGNTYWIDDGVAVLSSFNSNNGVSINIANHKGSYYPGFGSYFHGVGGTEAYLTKAQLQ